MIFTGRCDGNDDSEIIGRIYQVKKMVGSSMEFGWFNDIAKTGKYNIYDAFMSRDM